MSVKTLSRRGKGSAELLFEGGKEFSTKLWILFGGIQHEANKNLPWENGIKKGFFPCLHFKEGHNHREKGKLRRKGHW